MSSRKVILVSREARAYGGESPNAYKPWVNVEIRMSIPPNLGHGLLARRLLTQAVQEVYEKLTEEEN